MRATLKVLIALLLLIGPACGDDDDEPGAVATTTTAPPDTTTAPEVLGDEPPFHDDGPSGSGCTPGDTAGLPDGWWYGSIDGEVVDSVSFDLACYYTGAAAEEVAASRGDEVDNDYYVVNDNPALRTITVVSDATASCVDLTDQLAMVECEPSGVDGEWAVWLRVQGGRVDRIVEQYAP